MLMVWMMGLLKQLIYFDIIYFIYLLFCFCKREFVVKQDELKYEIAANNEPMFLEAKEKLKEQLQKEEFKKSSRLFSFR